MCRKASWAYEFNFDISAFLSYEHKNILEVKVKKLSENKSVNQAELESDFWNFGGIFRPVYLQINPVEYIEHLDIDAGADGTIKTDVAISKYRNDKKL
ncbi:sugar-binding domain-containing protein [Pedobacter sp. MC2016-24]|uniref:sugar-binding domain-containing protein n=1 Tax=Pedobacter sp. MC2016-24 TaxID=2780090 RepID=UPI00187DFDD8|nr:hypothetical protein [Pedobacter sp. MC2016-24]